MDLKAFGEQLHTLRKQAGLSQEGLVEALDALARGGPAADYRVVDGTLISRWERARTQAGRQWRPTRPYVLHLIQIFAGQFNEDVAQGWAAQAGYQVGATDLASIFRGVTIEPKQVSVVATAGDKVSALHNLQALLTSFIGREEEIAALIEYLSAPSIRLVTIVGEGGVGKTRLALAAAQAILDRRIPEDGIWFVPLAGLEADKPTRVGDQIATSIAKSLSFSFSAVDITPSAQLIEFLRAKDQLLILDNFEHLSAGAAFLTDLLLQAPRMRVLVTSRAPLNCQAEQVLALNGLPVQARDESSLLDVPSVRLFIERARYRQPAAASALDAQALRDLARLCHLVDGNPLAVELAANWLQHFTIAEMVDAVQSQDLSLLATEQQDVPTRHRSMQAVFETSWQLLSPDHRRTLARLSVFRGGFSREAALAVTDAPVADLATLVNRSLLHVTQESSGHRSYLVHELLRQFAAAKLAEMETELAGAAPTAHRHSHYYSRLLAERSDAFYGGESSIAVSGINAAIDNVRAAWRWAVTTGSVEIVAQSWLGLRSFYHIRGLYLEGERAFRDAATQFPARQSSGSSFIAASTASINLTNSTEALAADLRTAQAFFLNLLHRYAQAIEVARTVLAAMQEREASPAAARAQVEWGIALSLQSKHDEAIARLTEAVKLSGSQQLHAAEARALHAMSRNLLAKGEYSEANTALEQALSRYQQVSYHLAEGFVLRSLGVIAYLQGRFAQALSYWERTLAIYQDADDQSRVNSVWKFLGDAHAALGDLGGARGYYLTAYEHRDVAQDPRYAADTLLGLGVLMGRLGDYALALQYSQGALAAYRQLGYHSGVIEALYTRGWVQYEMGNAEKALADYREALDMCKASNAHMYRGAALSGMGKALAALERTDEAFGALQEALTIQRQLGQQLAAIETMGELARVVVAQGREIDGLAFVNELLSQLEASTSGERAPLPTYLICYRVLRTNDGPRAEQVLSTAYRLLQTQADSIDDEHLRESFLNGVTVNLEIAAAYNSAHPQAPSSSHTFSRNTTKHASSDEAISTTNTDA